MISAASSATPVTILIRRPRFERTGDNIGVGCT
jgi:hypothetical protein